jgi:hypothetical protein
MPRKRTRKSSSLCGRHAKEKRKKAQTRIRNATTREEQPEELRQSPRDKLAHSIIRQRRQEQYWKPAKK